jgi:hypothetical protein
MATYRGQGSDSFSIGSPPPSVVWTIVRGDTAAFRVYVTDSERVPLVISEWTIAMEVRRPSTSNSLVTTLSPEQTADDDDGEFTVSLSSGQSEDINTSDIFDIELSDGSRVWTICKGTITVIEDVTETPVVS